MQVLKTRWVAVLLAALGGAGCLNVPVAGPSETSAAMGTLVLTVKVGAPARRVTAVAADVDQVVVELSPILGTVPPDYRLSGYIKRIDKTMLAAGPVSVSFPSLPSLGYGNWELTLTALDADGRKIGRSQKGVHVEPGETKQEDVTLQLDPTWTSGGTGGLSPSFTFAAPLPTVGAVTLSHATGTAFEILGISAAGTVYVPWGSPQLRGFNHYNSDGVKTGTTTFQSTQYTVSALMDSAGQTWVFGLSQATKFGLDGQELGRYPVSSGSSKAKGIDPSGNLWFSSSDTTLTRMAPDGTVLGQHAVLTGDEDWLRDTMIEFDSQSGDGWILSGARVQKVSSSGNRQFFVDFPPPAVLDLPDPKDDQLQASTVDQDGNLWVARYDGRLFKVSTTGQLLGQYSAPLNVRWLLTDDNGDLWAVSASPSGQNLTKYATTGVAVGRNGTGFLPAAVQKAPDGSIWILHGNSPNSSTPPLLARLVP